MEIMLGEKLKELREKKGYKQADVADLVPVSPSGYRGWESGTTIPDTRTLAKLCEIFEVSADYLLFGKEEERKTEGVYELEIYKEEDRVAVVGILNKNGYATCMVSRLKNPGGKAKKYLVLARPCENGRGLEEIDC